jgi:hypothetical protein
LLWGGGGLFLLLLGLGVLCGLVISCITFLIRAGASPGGGQEGNERGWGNGEIEEEREGGKGGDSTLCLCSKNGL